MTASEMAVPLEPRPAVEMRGVVLITARDSGFLRRSEEALQMLGFETVTAHSPCVAEYVLDRRGDVDVVVVDGAVLGPVSVGRPGPLLVKSPTIPLVVANAVALDRDRRRLVRAYRAVCIESPWDVGSMTEAVTRLISETRLIGRVSRSCGRVRYLNS